MAHGLNSVLKRGTVNCGKSTESGGTKTGIGSRRIFSPQFKLQVLDSYRNDPDCRGNQRATARKYGIHRRQIQKWLQVENALRNGTGGGRQQAALGGCGRQRDDAVEARVPTPPGGRRTDDVQAPLDYTTRRRTPSPLPAEYGKTAPAPMDLSFKRPPTPQATPPLQPHVWDLSTKRLKRKLDDADSTTPIASPKPVKLFKPYLDDIADDEEGPAPPAPIRVTPPCCLQPPLECCLNNNNNNNNNCDGVTYTLHELQPKSYYYPGYYTNHLVEPTCCSYDTALKQRQSYSLDFKLSAIDCYYQDSMCKGNQRAVATKYNVHRRQVQKWLKQANELKSRIVR